MVIYERLARSLTAKVAILGDVITGYPRSLASMWSLRRDYMLKLMLRYLETESMT